jgi:hypothetical protein
VLIRTGKKHAHKHAGARRLFDGKRRAALLAHHAPVPLDVDAVDLDRGIARLHQTT